MALTLMCGLSFAGKSSFAKLLAAELGGRIISLDGINAERGLDGGQGIPLEEWATSDRIAHERAETLLRQGTHVIIDDTGSPRFIRDQWRATASTVRVPFVIVWIHIDPELQRERVAANRSQQQRHDVTDAVLVDHVAGFEFPTDENPLVIDASDTENHDMAAETANSIRQLTAR